MSVRQHLRNREHCYSVSVSVMIFVFEYKLTLCVYESRKTEKSTLKISQSNHFDELRAKKQSDHTGKFERPDFCA